MERVDAIKRCAAVICSHVVKGAPILRAVCDEPAFPEDSGWQFLCGVAPEEPEEGVQIWLVDEVIQKDPTLEKWLHLPPESTLVRTPDSDWRIVD